MFLPLIPERTASSHTVARLVYLAAIVPRPGFSVLDEVRTSAEMFNPQWLGKNPMDDDVAKSFLFHDCAAEMVEWALTTRRVMHAVTAMAEPCPLAQLPDIASDYVVCLADRTLTPHWMRHVARNRLGIDPIELPGGHCPHVSRPAALARALTREQLQPTPSGDGTKGTTWR